MTTILQSLQARIDSIEQSIESEATAAADAVRAKRKVEVDEIKAHIATGGSHLDMVVEDVKAWWGRLMAWL